MRILKGPTDLETLEAIQGLSIFKLIELMGKNKSHEPIFDLGINNNALITNTIDETDKNKNTSLHLAAQFNYPKIVQYLIDQGYNIDVVNESGNTPLTTATIHGNIDIVKLLVSNNANLTIIDELGRTALDKAILWKRNDIFEFLTNV